MSAQNPAGSPGRRRRTSVKLMGGTARRGEWRVPERTVLVSLVGGASLDLTEAHYGAPEVTITKVSLIGGTHVKVPQGVAVDVGGFSLIGGVRDFADPPLPPDAQRVNIRNYGIIGGVRVTRV